jgi:hypothetical protein
MDLKKSSKMKSDNENGCKIRWYRKRRTKDKENLESHEKHNFFNAIKKNFLWKFRGSKRQNKVKSTENLDQASPTPGDGDDEEDFARLFIRQAQNPIHFSSIGSRESTVSNFMGSQPSTSQANETSHQNQDVSSLSLEPPAIAPPTTEPEPEKPQDDFESLMESVQEDLQKFPWYWPNLGRTEAQKILGGRPNGSFLVRDSSTNKNQFTVSFRSSGVTLHCRINFKDNSW